MQPIVLAVHQVPKDVVLSQRLSDYLCGIFTQLPSRKSVKNAIKKGAVYVNGQQGRTGDWVLPEQTIELRDINRAPTKILELDLEVLFEDEDLAVVYKPAGIPVSGNQFRTIENALLHNIQVSSKVDAFKKPRPVHRLDAPTSGLLLVAKTKQTRIHLGSQFEKRTIKKRYQAIVIGRPHKEGTIDLPVDGKASLSYFENLETIPSLKSKELSLLNLYPQTGRTHQLRIHLAESGFPILGDTLYGQEGLIMKHKGLFLAAVELTFLHPVTEKEHCIQIKTPHKFTALLEREERRFKRYHADK